MNLTAFFNMSDKSFYNSKNFHGEIILQNDKNTNYHHESFHPQFIMEKFPINIHGISLSLNRFTDGAKSMLIERENLEGNHVLFGTPSNGVNIG